MRTRAFEATDELRRELGAGLDEAGFPLRLSAGISTYPYDGAAATQLLRAADQALYHAKARGKNQVVGFREILRRRVRRRSCPPARSDRSRSGSGADGSALVGAMDAAAAIWAEESVDGRAGAAGKAIAFVVGATAHQHLEGRGCTARRHDEARDARHRPGRGLLRI